MENKEWRKNYLSTKRGHLTRHLAKTKERAATQNLPHDIDLEYLESIATDECPVFKTPFVWGQGKGHNPFRPSIDRIVPELGYVKGNLAFISMKANTIKQDVTEKELYAVADWLHEARKKVLNATKNSTTPVSEGSDREGEIYPELGSFPAPGTRENHYDLDHYQRTISGDDSDYCAQKSGGDSMGYRDKKVGTFS